MRKIIPILMMMVLMTVAFALADTNISSCQNINTPDTYLLTSDINSSEEYACLNILTDNVTIDCQGYTIFGNGSFSTQRGVSTGSNSNITIRDCVFTEFTDSGIYMYGVENVNILNNSFSNLNKSIFGGNTTNVLIDGNTMTDTLSGVIIPVSTTNNNSGITITNNTFTNASNGDGYITTVGGTGFQTYRITDVEIANNEMNIVSDVTYYLNVVAGVEDVEIHHNTVNSIKGITDNYAFYVGNYFDNVSVYNNEINGTVGFQMFYEGVTTNNKVYNNNFYNVENTGGGIGLIIVNGVGTSNDLEVYGNNITDSSTYITFSGDYSKIYDNRIVNISSNGFALSYNPGTGGKVYDNYISDVIFGIRARDSQDVEIYGNTLDDVNLGIQVRASTNTTVRNNTMTNIRKLDPNYFATPHGINIRASGGGHTIYGNSVTNANVSMYFDDATFSNISVYENDFTISTIGLDFGNSVINGYLNVTRNNIYNNLDNLYSDVARNISGNYYGDGDVNASDRFCDSQPYTENNVSDYESYCCYDAWFDVCGTYVSPSENIPPEDPVRESPEAYVIYDLAITPIYFSVVDNDTQYLNCSLYYSNRTDILSLIDPQLSSNDPAVLNNTVSYLNLDLVGYQSYLEEQPIYYQISCSDGINESSSFIYTVNTRPQFLYTSEDVSKAMINLVVTILVTISLFVVVFLIALSIVFGWKYVKKRL